ncbi:hypothetical protein NK6_1325 [Bradyrhizobium diazoefficiens]|uniref:Uncharacterized protein n=1 Tax=Bradyrhizobium diazoefficiens TaxID=1355477 RepID=A0A0E4FVG9_9BRAD|nr:hypothetical protein NK6_1325 [Bradyrhizobium diazoefficiens]
MVAARKMLFPMLLLDVFMWRSYFFIPADMSICMSG